MARDSTTASSCATGLPGVAAMAVALRRCLLQRVLQLPRALRQALLFAGERAHGILAGVALRRLAELGRDLPLRVGELPRLELHLAERAAPLVGPRRLELLLQLAQFLERAVAARARLARILAPQFARRVAHLLA